MMASGVTDIIVVTGHEAVVVSAALNDVPVRIVHNPRWAQGMGTSVSVGVEALSSQASGALIVPGDMPLVSADLVASLIAAFQRADAARIVYPVTLSGEQRNPVLWPRRYFSALRSLSGDQGAKPLLTRHGADCTAIPIDDESVFIDVDTPDALKRIATGSATPSPLSDA